MKRIFLFVTFIFITFLSYAQSAIVTGTVADSLSLVGEPGTVIRISGNKMAEDYILTDEDGRFSYRLCIGKYSLLINNIGRKARTINFSIEGADTLDLGMILLQDDIQTLKAGTVTAQRNLVKVDVDKVTYEVEEDVDAKTSSVLDMLRKVPMVAVDGQDNITVNGSSSFLIQIDGRINPMMSSNPSQTLKSLPASFVRNIEVITSPGARYDAEGVGGVLNIITSTEGKDGKSVLDGQYGNIGATVTTRGAGTDALYNLKKNKWTVSVNGSAMFSVNKDTCNEIERVHKAASGETSSVAINETDIRIPMYSANMNISYDVDSLNLVSASAGWSHFGMISEGTSVMNMNSAYGSSGYDGATYNKNTRNTVSATLDYQHTWAGNKDKVLVLSYLFSGYPSVNDIHNTYTNVSGMPLGMNDRKTNANTNSITQTAQADFTTPFADKNHKISMGVKFISRHNRSLQKDFIYAGDGYIYDEKGSLDYDFINNIGSVYSEYDGRFGKISAKVGLRYEHTWQNVHYSEGDGTDFRLDYGNLVPNAGLMYNIDMMRNIGLTYNMRISRPGITYLNPYVDASDPTALSYGNTDLKTDAAHNVSLTYSHISSKWILNMSLRDTYSGNGISKYSFYDDSGLLNTTYGNIVSSNNLGLNTFVTWIPGRKIRVIFNGGAGYSTFSSNKLQQSNAGWSYNAMVGYQHTLPLDIRLSSNIIATGHNVNLQGWHSGIVMGTLSLTKSFLEERLTLSVSGVTHLTGGRGMKQVTWSEGHDFTNKVTNVIPMQTATLNIRYAFGKQESAKVKKVERSIRNDAELNSKSMAESLGTMGGM